MDKIYEKIKEGGYDFERLGNPKSVKERDNAFVLDPLAWQALGKKKGWLDWAVCLTCGTKVPVFRECNCDIDEDTQPEPQMAWEWYWHKFIHVLATEGWDKAVAYLEDLINQE